MFNHFRLGPAPDLQMVTMMHGVHFPGGAASAADVQQVQRAGWDLAGRQANQAGFLRQAFGQVQENFRLDRLRQRLRRAVGSQFELVFAQIAIAQRGAVAAVDKHQPTGIDAERQRLQLLSAHRRGLRFEELLLQQALQRRVFPVFMLARWPAEAQRLLPVRQRMRRTLAAAAFEQAIQLLQRV